jgi:hypothetical protein
MEILTFNQFKILLEAKEDPSEPIQNPAPEPPDDDDETSEAPPENPLAGMSTDAPADPSMSAPADTTSDLGGSFQSPVSQPDPFSQDSTLDSQTLPEDPNLQPDQSSDQVIRFAILDPEKKWHTKYSDTGGIKRFTEYRIMKSELEKWITDNNLESNKDEIMSGVYGKEKINKDLISKLKSDIDSEKLGSSLGDVDIQFDDKLAPSTGDLDLVFVTAK